MFQATCPQRTSRINAGALVHVDGEHVPLAPTVNSPSFGGLELSIALVPSFSAGLLPETSWRAKPGYVRMGPTS